MSKTWSKQDKQRFSDRDILRASSVPPQRYVGPTADEWDWRNDEELDAQ